ncbi:MAG TPA: thioredoxin-dependent thiol peroxidase [Gemmatimonadales bacterium]|nr:thioredoxin-dependent thiol peroxidase [Gemmatimonadales bacterium]
MITPGTKAPDFTLTSDEGQAIRLSALKGRPVVLYFYPKDDTPGCTKEACSFRDAWADVRETGAALFGISPDGPTSHQQFRAKYRLQFPLLSDPDHAVAAAYGAWGEKSMYGRRYEGILRTTFVIDGTGVVRRVFEKVKPDGHADQVLAAIRELY